MYVLLEFIKILIQYQSSGDMLKELAELFEYVFQLMPVASKWLGDLGRMEPTSSLQHRVAL